jgi:hypothetical protein
MGGPHQGLEQLRIAGVTLQFQQSLDNFGRLVFRLYAEQFQHGDIG